MLLSHRSRAFLCLFDRECSSKAHQVLPKTFWSKPVARTLWVLVRSRSQYAQRPREPVSEFRASSQERSDLFCIRRILELAFDNDTQTAKLEQHVGAVLSVGMDRLCVRRDTEFRDQQRELGVDRFCGEGIVSLSAFRLLPEAIGLNASRHAGRCSIRPVYLYFSRCLAILPQSLQRQGQSLLPPLAGFDGSCPCRVSNSGSSLGDQQRPQTLW